MLQVVRRRYKSGGHIAQLAILLVGTPHGGGAAGLSVFYHAATGCTEIVAQDDGHAALIGYALDGYAIHAMSNSGGMEPGDLGECRGHSDETRGYHYHAASAAENMFIGCFRGEQGTVQ